MAQIVDLPNGQEGEFPDNMSRDEIQSVLRKQFGYKEPKKSYLEKAGQFAEENINKPARDIVQGAGDFTMGAAQGLANIGPGLYNLGAKAANLIPGVNIKEKKGYNFAPNNLNASLGELASFFGPGMLGKAGLATETASHIQRIPEVANAIKKASDILSKSSEENKLIKLLTGKTTKSTAYNALLGALMNPEDQGLGASLGALGTGIGKISGTDNKLLSALARAAGGGAIGYGLGDKTGAEIGAGIGLGAPKTLELLGKGKIKPGQETLKGINYEEVLPSVESANKLGTPLTPAEASRNPVIGSLQGGYARTNEAAAENVRLGMERKENEKKAITSLLDDIYDRSISSDNNINELYRNSYKYSLKPHIIDYLKEDPLINEAFDKVEENTRWKRKLQGVSENNYAYLDKVKKSLSDEEKSLMKSGRLEEAKEVTEARKSLEQIMDNNNPYYKNARSEAQKKIVRRQMEKKLKSKEINGSNFYKTFISNENNYKELHNSLKNVPEAQEKLNDMKQAWHSLINIQKPSTSSYRAETGLEQSRARFSELYEAINNFLGLKKNKKAIQYIRSDKWIKDLKNMNLETNSNKKEEIMSNIFGKLFPGSLSMIEKGSNNDNNI